MMKSRFTESPIVSILNEADAGLDNNTRTHPLPTISSPPEIAVQQDAAFGFVDQSILEW
jgi:hypothetical protein